MAKVDEADVDRDFLCFASLVPPSPLFFGIKR
jgi:hypothetical protein